MFQRTALVVEDDSLMAMTVRAVLMSRGWDVEMAADGDTALKMLTDSERRYSLAMVDLFLPHLTGKELIRRVKAERRSGDLTMMVLTGSSDEQDVVDAFAAGADDVLLKPLRPLELFARLDRLERRN